MPDWYVQRGPYRFVTEQGEVEVMENIRRLDPTAADPRQPALVAAKGKHGWAWRVIPAGENVVAETLKKASAMDDLWAIVRAPVEVETEVRRVEDEIARKKAEEERKKQEERRRLAMEKAEAAATRQRVIAISIGAIFGSLITWSFVKDRFARKS